MNLVSDYMDLHDLLQIFVIQKIHTEIRKILASVNFCFSNVKNASYKRLTITDIYVYNTNTPHLILNMVNFYLNGIPFF